MFLWIFFEFLSNEFAACSKPPSRDNHREDSCQGPNNVTRVRGKPRSCDQDRRKNDAFTLSATLPTKELHYLTRCVALKFENLVTSGRYFFELKGLSLDGLAM